MTSELPVHKYLIILAVFTIAFFGVLGCEMAEVDGDETTGCKTHAECPTGQFCMSNGVCQKVECMTSADCPQGFHCIQGNMCVVDGDTSYGCQVTGYCPDGYYCDSDDTCKPKSGDTGGGTDNSADGDFEWEFDGECNRAIDTDDDELPDCIEDTNGDGVFDAGETDPNNPDTDDDGLLDGEEDKNGDGVRQYDETDPRDPDSDTDLLLDGQEDKNNNGIVDEGETDPLDSDTDKDGISDGIELSGNYKAGSSSDPLKKDSDGDGLEDGEEDGNHNGVYEPDLGETDPTLTDSNGDGTPDNEESVNLICVDGQVKVVSLYDNAAGNWTLALLPEYSYLDVDLVPTDTERLKGAVFEETAVGIGGFILLRNFSSNLVADQLVDDNVLLATLPIGGELNHRGRIFQTYDGFPTAISQLFFSDPREERATAEPFVKSAKYVLGAVSVLLSYFSLVVTAPTTKTIPSVLRMIVSVDITNSV